MLEMRRHYGQYLKGLSHVKEYRMRLVNSLELPELHDILDACQEAMLQQQ